MSAGDRSEEPSANRRRRPIFHLSVPVRDLPEAVAFYRAYLGAQIGRHTAEFADALVFGAQVTLQDDPGSVSHPMPRTRHFGATLPWDEWEKVVSHLGRSEFVVEAPKVSFEGEPTEQGKLMIADPSGNLIEIKAYRHPSQVLGSLPDE
jgi:extradiol dioxygenase family protein